MKIFGKDKKKEEPAPPPEKRRVYDESRNARWGARFVSFTFESSPDSMFSISSRMKAIQRPDLKWDLFSIHQYQESFAGSDLKNCWTDQKRAGEGLCFFAALDKVAEFEASEESMGHVRAEADEAGKLGSEHIRAFAHREGILFDRSGRPHEARDAEIVTEGAFDNKEIAALKTEYKPPRENLNIAFNAAASDDIVRALMPAPAAEAGALESVTSLLDRRDHMKAFIAALDEVINHWKAGLEKPFDDKCMKYTYKEKVFDAYDDYYYKNVTRNLSAYEISCKILDSARQMISEKGDAGAALARGIETCRLALGLCWAQKALGEAMNAKKTMAAVRPSIDGYFNDCVDAMKKLGLPEMGRERLEAAVLQGAKAGKPAISTPVMEFRKSCDGFRQKLESEALAHAAAAVKPGTLSP